MMHETAILLHSISEKNILRSKKYSVNFLLAYNSVGPKRRHGCCNCIVKGENLTTYGIHVRNFSPERHTLPCRPGQDSTWSDRILCFHLIFRARLIRPPVDRGSTHLWNVGILPRDYKALHAWKLSCSCGMQLVWIYWFKLWTQKF
jgi:hypothetical protein